jgi:hypothetical protein
MEDCHRSALGRSPSNKGRGLIMAAALLASVTGLFVGLGTSRPASAAQSVAVVNVAGGPESGGGGPNAPSGPASGGTSILAGSVPNASFTLTTSAAQEVTVDEVSSTKSKKGITSSSATAVKSGEVVFAVGTTSGAGTAGSHLIVDSAGGDASTTAATAALIPFPRAAPIPTTTKEVGQTAAGPGGLVERVVTLSNGEYSAHYIGVNGPPDVFVSPAGTVPGAE